MKNKIDLNRELTILLFICLGLVLFFYDKINNYNYVLLTILFIISVLCLISFITNQEYKTKNYNNLVISIITIWLSTVLYLYYDLIMLIFPLFISLLILIYFISELIKHINKKEHSLIKILTIFILEIIFLSNLLSLSISIKLFGIIVIIITIYSVLKKTLKKKK